ncbi:hypothetical protein HanIR_Chr04g0204981 [Helianthus annuus]|nr:hypothetical protein HanIR_Chr04g0204981 [Helianthus annuus]
MYRFIHSLPKYMDSFWHYISPRISRGALVLPRTLWLLLPSDNIVYIDLHNTCSIHDCNGSHPRHHNYRPCSHHFLHNYRPCSRHFLHNYRPCSRHLHDMLVLLHR